MGASVLRLVLILVSAAFVPLFATAPASTLAPSCGAAIGDPYVVGPGHDHADPAHHALWTQNMEMVGHVDPPPRYGGIEFAPAVLETEVIEHHEGLFLDDEGHAQGARFGEVDVHGTFAALAATSSPNGVWIVDVADPSAPAVVGRWNGTTSGYVTDVKWSTGGEAIYASIQGASSSGMFLIDARDRTAPVTADQVVVQNGVHMIGVWSDASGVDRVFGATGASNGVFPYLATGDLPVKRFIPLPPITAVTAHDVWVERDTLLDRVVLYVANSYAGWRAFDVTVPGSAVPLLAWNGDSALYMHTIRAEVRDGQRIVYVSPEYFYGTSTRVATFYAFDATDPNAISLLGTWQNPGGKSAGNLLFSTHNFQLVDGTVYLANYHAGVWALDASAPATIASSGYYLPHDHTVTGPPGSWPTSQVAPSSWDVVLRDGLMYVGDITGGLYVLHRTCDPVGPGGPTSRG